jgi:hypothetical protein
MAFFLTCLGCRTIHLTESPLRITDPLGQRCRKCWHPVLPTSRLPILGNWRPIRTQRLRNVKDWVLVVIPEDVSRETKSEIPHSLPTPRVPHH